MADLTLMTFRFIGQQDGKAPPELADVLHHLLPDVQRSARMASMKIPDAATARRYRAPVAKMTDFAGRRDRAGVPPVAGTHSLPGLVLHSELIGCVQASLVATLNGARYTGTLLADRGRIAPGLRADLILVDASPSSAWPTSAGWRWSSPTAAGWCRVRCTWPSASSRLSMPRRWCATWPRADMPAPPGGAILQARWTMCSKDFWTTFWTIFWTIFWRHPR